MATEDLTGTSKFIDDFVLTNPVSTSDTVASMATHQRGIKNVLNNSFGAVTGAVTSTHTELNTLDGFTGTTADLNKTSKLTSQEGATFIDGYVIGTGTPNAIVATYSPAITSLVNGLGVTVLVPTGTVSSTAPTLNVNALGAKTIIKGNDAPLSLSDLYGSNHTIYVVYSSVLDKWQLMNPSASTTQEKLAYLAASQTITTATDTAISFDGSVYDGDSLHSVSTNPTRITLGTNAYKPILFGQITFTANATGVRRVKINKDGSTFFGYPKVTSITNHATEETVLQIFTPPLSLVAGYYELIVYQDSGGNLDVIGDSSGLNTWFGYRGF